MKWRLRGHCALDESTLPRIGMTARQLASSAVEWLSRRSDRVRRLLEARRVHWRPRNRLKGFEPSTFCMASRSMRFPFGADIPRKYAGSRTGVSFGDSPAFPASSRGFGHRMGTRAVVAVPLQVMGETQRGPLRVTRSRPGEGSLRVSAARCREYGLLVLCRTRTCDRGADTLRAWRPLTPSCAPCDGSESAQAATDPACRIHVIAHGAG
jgi:hypothetical protein